MSKKKTKPYSGTVTKRASVRVLEIKDGYIKVVVESYRFSSEGIPLDMVEVGPFSSEEFCLKAGDTLDLGFILNISGSLIR